MTITVVTPWHEHAELWDDYEQAVILGGPDELLVVDNGTTPPLEFAQVRLQTNTGFSQACNVGLELATSDAVLFLNNDIAGGDRGWLDRIRDAVEPGVLVGHWREDRHSAVDGEAMPYLDGWCLAGMRDDLLSLGGFDETLMEPAYYSDNLLCLEARAAGMTLREVRTGLTHKGGVTSRPSANPRVAEATAANRARYEARVRQIRGNAWNKPSSEAVGAHLEGSRSG